MLAANTVMACVLVYFQYLSMKNMGIAYFQRFYGLIDIFYITMCMTIFLMQFIQLSTDGRKEVTFE